MRARWCAFFYSFEINLVSINFVTCFFLSMRLITIQLKQWKKDRQLIESLETRCWNLIVLRLYSDTVKAVWAAADVDALPSIYLFVVLMVNSNFLWSNKNR